MTVTSLKVMKVKEKTEEQVHREETKETGKHVQPDSRLDAFTIKEMLGTYGRPLMGPGG